MNKLFILLSILIFSSGLFATSNDRIRIFASGCISGKVKNSNIDHTTKGDFRLAYAFGIEQETLKENYIKGVGFRFVVPPKVDNATYNYENSEVEEDLDMLINASIYWYHKVMIPFNQDSGFYLKFKYGSGFAYFIHLGVGGGFQIADHFTIEAEYNYHMSTIILATSSTSYLGINLGYSF